jgi:hypothetical protein
MGHAEQPNRRPAPTAAEERLGHSCLGRLDISYIRKLREIDAAANFQAVLTAW